MRSAMAGMPLATGFGKIKGKPHAASGFMNNYPDKHTSKTDILLHMTSNLPQIRPNFHCFHNPLTDNLLYKPITKLQFSKPSTFLESYPIDSQ